MTLDWIHHHIDSLMPGQWASIPFIPLFPIIFPPVTPKSPDDLAQVTISDVPLSFPNNPVADTYVYVIINHHCHYVCVIFRKHLDAGLPDNSIQLDLKGSAGQSFAAFLSKGVHITLEGDANDYVGKVGPRGSRSGRAGGVAMLFRVCQTRGVSLLVATATTSGCLVSGQIVLSLSRLSHIDAIGLWRRIGARLIGDWICSLFI